MLIPVKHSVAVMIFNGDKVLSVRRPDDDDELPGVWGLPAGTLRASETIKDLIGRIGRDKLGVELTPRRKVASGKQLRRLYLLEMELWEASMTGSPFSLRLRPTLEAARYRACASRGLALRGHPDWRWATLDSLRPGAERPGRSAAPWRYKPKAASANHWFSPARDSSRQAIADAASL